MYITLLDLLGSGGAPRLTMDPWNAMQVLLDESASVEF
jgi:hypothetical protein